MTAVTNAQLSASSPQPPAPNTQPPSAERRQLTVMFCDLVGSTALSEQLDPEEYREVVRNYQTACAEVISRYDGHIAQYLGDGLLVYFGYPVAHEDDATRAIRAGLEIVAALRDQGPGNGQRGKPRSLHVRLGIHTGQVVVGEMGAGNRREQLALGDTPNIAARLQSLAEPDTVILSTATQRLVAGLFTCRDLGPHTLKGVLTPTRIYQVVSESAARNRFEVEANVGLTPLIGRDEEFALLWRHWERAKDGEGQVVLLSGEPGIGKSRLAREFRERVMREHATSIEFFCSPYHQNSAFYPIVDGFQRLLQWQKDDSAPNKLEKLQTLLARYRFPQPETLPLLAALLSLPSPVGISPLNLSPQRQKQKTQEALIAWLLEEAAQHTVCCAWEDLHWADPSSLEFLQLLIEQVPAAQLYVLLTFRPEFTSPWGARSHLSQLTLNRLGRNQISHMVENVAGGKNLPADILQQIIAKTDGVPLFVEELTKSVMESMGTMHESPRQLAIPTTLHDSLMARLDRLDTAKDVAQLGATIGREFSYELLHAISPLSEEALQQALSRLVEAELIYQRGLLPQARYIFKHALVQDAAYQSLLKSTRQQYHQRIARVLEDRFIEVKENQPELLARHYTEAGLLEQAIPYWQQAGQRAIERSANVEAIGHLKRGLEVLKSLPVTLEHTQQELTMQVALGVPLIATRGYSAPEVGEAYTRARELCRHMGETPQLFAVLRGLQFFYLVRAEYKTARELAEQLFTLAQRAQDSAALLEAHVALGISSFWLGEFASARVHLEQGITLYNFQQHRVHAFRYGQDPGLVCLFYAALVLWHLGYPDQALKRSQEVLTLARELSHPLSLAFALVFTAIFHQFRREAQATQGRAEAAIALSVEQGFPQWVALGTILRGWTLAAQGKGEDGIAQIRQGLTGVRATGAEVGRPYRLALLAEAYKEVAQAEEGLNVLAEALTTADKTGELMWEAELYRLKGELLLQLAKK